MIKKVGIVGTGTAGLHLGLYLRQHGIEVTIFTDTASLRSIAACGCLTPWHIMP